jgi:hypothetical protein
VAIACLTNVPLWFFLFLKTLNEKVKNRKKNKKSNNTQEDTEKVNILKNKLLSDEAQTNLQVFKENNNNTPNV